MQTISWKNESPERKILWDYASALIAYSTITPLYFQGLIAGSEFLTYNAGKLYIALQLNVGFGGIPNATIFYFRRYNMADVSMSDITNSCTYWDTTAAAPKHVGNLIQLTNTWFNYCKHIY